MKPGHLMCKEERREHLETSLTNAEYMLKLERDISTGRGWSEQAKSAALKAIPGWESRIAELKLTLKGF